jgi:hypothetical protein
MSRAANTPFTLPLNNRHAKVHVNFGWDLLIWTPLSLECGYQTVLRALKLFVDKTDILVFLLSPNSGSDKIRKVYSLECTDIPKVLMPHHAGFCRLMWSKVIVTG